MNNTEELQRTLTKSMELANQLHHALYTGSFVAVAVQNPQFPGFYYYGDWAGEMSCHNFQQPQQEILDKLNTLMGQQMVNDQQGKVRRTPMHNNSSIGGMRFSNQNIDVGVVTTNWPHTESQFVVAATLYNAITPNGIRLHHTGIPFICKEMFDKTVARHPNTIKRSVANKEYVYVFLGNNGYYLEFKYDPDYPNDNIHLDVVVISPKHFLEFLGTCFDQEPVILCDYPNGAKGKIELPNSNGESLCIVAREKWWNVQESRESD